MYIYDIYDIYIYHIVYHIVYHVCVYIYIYILDSIRTPHMQSQYKFTPRRGSVVGAHQASGGEVDVLFEICYIINKH